MEALLKEIEQLKLRNKKVEADKAREVSTTRKISIMLLTYIAIVLFFYIVGIPKPRINASVPTIGFMLATLSLSIFKKLRLKHRKN